MEYECEMAVETGIILAGGKSMRMGQNKAFLKINGLYLIDHVLRTFHRIFKKTIIVTMTPEEYWYTNETVVTDAIPGAHALGGLYTGLLRAQTERCFICACDMPFLQPGLVKALLRTHDACAIAPIVYNRPQPLCAVYSKACLPVMKEQILKKDHRLSTVLSRLNAHYLPQSACELYDPRLLSFVNINTPEDYQKWSAI